jgi:hypothetical protein
MQSLAEFFLASTLAAAPHDGSLVATGATGPCLLAIDDGKAVGRFPSRILVQ